MRSNHLTVGFIRRGFSPSGGAETYLKRLAGGMVESGHKVRLYTDAEWPPNEWPFGPITRVPAKSAIAFADEMGKLISPNECNVVMSLERIWRCDVYRAGDGVHRAWLERRAAVSDPVQKLMRLLNPKHSAALALEESLFTKRGAGQVIANSQMVKDEIVRLYDFPSDKIDVVYNGVPVERFRADKEIRERNREKLGLSEDDVAVLFAGTGWERKGLRYAITGLEGCGHQMRLFVAGRGEKGKFQSAQVEFLGEKKNMRELYAAGDIFLLPTIYDPFSNACLEALAAGLPVITTRANGFSEVIENGVHGSLIDDARDAAAIGDALVFWSDRERREEARFRILERAARFDISANVARTSQILAQIAASAAST